MALREYVRKRDFAKTPEPRGKVSRDRGNSFVIQKHAASRLHYDFRIEMEGVMRSWAVPKGPSLDPGEKRLAVHVEDHPLEYSGFEGIIPKGEYGGGTVIVWDRGTWEPEGDPVAGYRKGKLTFSLKGEKLSGTWTLFRLGSRAGDEEGKNWMLVKRRDDVAASGRAAEITVKRPESVLSGRTIEDVARDPRRQWSSRGGGETELAPAQGVKPAKATRAVSSTRRTKSAPAATELARLPGVRRGDLPASVPPQLCTLVTEVPEGDEWIHEIKLDGYRVLCRIEGRNVRLVSRNGNDWTRRMDSIAGAAARLGVESAILDGEVVVQAKDGVSSFQALQVALGAGDLDALSYHVFDVVHLDGWDLRGVPLLQRKAVLEKLLADAGPPLAYVDHVVGRGEAFRKRACQLGLEGVVSKQADKPYRGRRTPEWLKIRCGLRQELVIVGFTAPQGARKHLGAVLVGYYEGDELRYAGKVGTGFADQALADLRAKFDALIVPKSPLAHPPRGADAKGVTWIRPELVADVEFTDWTRDGRLRHPSFEGLREDKPAREVRRERPADMATTAAEAAPEASVEAPATKAKAKSTTKARAANRPAVRTRSGAAEDAVVAGIRITHPERVLYPETGATKLDVARYLQSVAEWMLPHVSGRLLTLVRCPTGRGGQCFYQKHLATHVSDDVKRVDVREKDGSGEYAYVDDAPGLVALAQSGVLEIHAWGSRVPDIEHPDLIVIDMDPAPDVPWDRVVEATLEIRDELESMGLRSFVKTTGGKGLHACVPLVPRADWDEVKEFCRTFVEDLARRHPTQFLTKASKDARRGKIFLDWLRNGRGATAVVPYSMRAREGAPVATPLRWEELTVKLDPRSFTIDTVPRRLARLKSDPWEGMLEVRQQLPGASQVTAQSPTKPSRSAKASKTGAKAAKTAAKAPKTRAKVSKTAAKSPKSASKSPKAAAKARTRR